MQKTFGALSFPSSYESSMKSKKLTKLYRAIKSKDYDAIKKGLQTYSRSSLCEESILFLGHFIDEETVGFLLQNGVNANEQDEMGDTVLNYASAENNVKEMELLIRHGAFLDFPNVHGEDAFSFACVKGALDAAIFLYNHGSKMQWVKKNWDTNTLYGNNFLSNEIIDFLKSIHIFDPKLY